MTKFALAEHESKLGGNKGRKWRQYPKYEELAFVEYMHSKFCVLLNLNTYQLLLAPVWNNESIATRQQRL